MASWNLGKSNWKYFQNQNNNKKKIIKKIWHHTTWICTTTTPQSFILHHHHPLAITASFLWHLPHQLVPTNLRWPSPLTPVHRVEPCCKKRIISITFWSNFNTLEKIWLVYREMKLLLPGGGGGAGWNLAGWWWCRSRWYGAKFFLGFFFIIILN